MEEISSLGGSRHRLLVVYTVVVRNGCILCGALLAENCLR